MLYYIPRMLFALYMLCCTCFLPIYSASYIFDKLSESAPFFMECVSFCIMLGSGTLYGYNVDGLCRLVDYGCKWLIKTKTEWNKMEISQSKKEEAKIKLEASRQNQGFLDKTERINTALNIVKNVVDIACNIKHHFSDTPKETKRTQVYTSIFEKSKPKQLSSARRDTSLKVLYVMSKK